MPPLEGNTLGEKHKSFNKLVQDAIANKQFKLTKINNDDNDIDNLLKIHVASKTKNVEYIMRVLKCDDMLYVSSAIKQSMWLITEQEYAQIVNPVYLHTELFPYMLTKAINKLLLHIRLHLKDETRNESFFNYLKETSNDANKWLLNCSIPFIEDVIQKERSISLQLYKRLCKRSIFFLKYYDKVFKRSVWQTLKSVLFLLKSNTEEYLNILDITDKNSLPPLEKKYTEIIMKKYPNRIWDNFEKYIDSVDFTVIAKYLKKEDIKNFLFRQMKNNKTNYYFRNYNNLKHFINNMPQEDRFEFVKKTYIDKNQAAGLEFVTSEQLADTTDNMPTCSVSTYCWYEFAPFNEAFIELKKLIRAENSPTERYKIMTVLITCAKKEYNNQKHIKKLLQYYYDKHRNEPFKIKIQFVNQVVSQMATHEFERETWEILDKLFHTMEVYIESDNQVQSCLKAIVIYKVLHDEIVPDIIETKLKFKAFKKREHKWNLNQQNKIVHFLLAFILRKINDTTINNESDLEITVSLLKDAFNFLKEWDKDNRSFIFFHEIIQKLLKIKKENSWKTNMSTLYNINKSYRRQMFEESMTLCPGQAVCLNALKHEPDLLTRYSAVVHMLRVDDSISLQHILYRLRIYWPHSLAKQWTDAYLKQLDENTGHRATVRGLFVLLPQNQLLRIAKKYVPEDNKIDWNEIGKVKFNIRKQIANNLCKARPLIPLDSVLWYAKGDYLQFAVPSLNCICHNISIRQSRDYVFKLLKAPVSLQKHGLHFAFMKLKYDELKQIFFDIWQTAMNVTIRNRIFSYTYKLICTVKDPLEATELWELLGMFIDTLPLDENKTIFTILGNAKKVHAFVRGQFYMKSYEFLKSLPPAANCGKYKNSLICYGPNIIDLLDNDFITDILLSPTNDIISSPSYQFINITSTYVLHGQTEVEQCERFRKVLVPALEEAFSWHTVNDNTRVYIIKQNIDALFRALIWDLRKFICFKNIIIPVKLFTEIKALMERKMFIEENYVRYTSWTLTNEYIKLVAKNKDMFCDKKLDNIFNTSDFENDWLPENAEYVWQALHSKISPELGSIFVNILKDHTETYCPSICWLFCDALNRFFKNLNFPRVLMKMETLKCMVFNSDFIPSYLVVCNEIPQYGDDEEIKKRSEIRQILFTHPSLEVRMHYHRTFDAIIDPMV